VGSFDRRESYTYIFTQGRNGSGEMIAWKLEPLAYTGSLAAAGTLQGRDQGRSCRVMHWTVGSGFAHCDRNKPSPKGECLRLGCVD
jgi:hypothetical protein